MNWWPQLPGGQLHLDGFESLSTKKITDTRMGICYFMAEDEGFEPPQTESESGVLPLHKSSKFGTVLLYPIFGKCQAQIF